MCKVLLWSFREPGSLGYCGLSTLELQSAVGPSYLPDAVAPTAKGTVRTHLHQVSVSMLRQLCNYASKTVLIENNGVAQKRVAALFWSGSIVVNENTVTSIIAEYPQC